jgi:hypothetical protein
LGGNLKHSSSLPRCTEAVLKSANRIFGRNLTNAERSGCFTYREADALKESDIFEFIAEVPPAYVLNLIGTFRTDSFENLLAVNVGVRRSS